MAIKKSKWVYGTRSFFKIKDRTLRQSEEDIEMSMNEGEFQQQFKELLAEIYVKGQETECLLMEDVMNEIQTKLMILLETTNQ